MVEIKKLMKDMNNLFKWLLIFVIGMMGAFFTYKIYGLSSEWGFTIAFVGGAITMNVVQFIRKDYRNN